MDINATDRSFSNSYRSWNVLLLEGGLNDDKWSTDQNGIDLKRLLSIPRLKKIIIREGLAEGEKNFVSLVNPSPEWKVQDLVSDCYIKDTLTFKNRYRFSCTFVRL